MNTTPIVAPRTAWQSILNLVSHTTQGGAERVMSVSVTEKDYETNGFLHLRLKLMQHILRGLNDEKLEQMVNVGERTKEAEVEIDLTIAELTYLDMVLDFAASQWTPKFKQGLWDAISLLVTQEKESR